MKRKIQRSLLKTDFQKDFKKMIKYSSDFNFIEIQISNNKE